MATFAFLQYGVRSNIKGERSERIVGGICLLNFSPPSFFIRCCLIYSGLRWHRGLDPACCQTKPPQSSHYYSDYISALTPMRSPQCYVSPTEKHTEKDAVLWVEVLLYWCCTDKGNTHTHTQCSHICRHAQKGLLCVHWDFFFPMLMGFWGLALFFFSTGNLGHTLCQDNQDSLKAILHLHWIILICVLYFICCNISKKVR